MGILYLDFTDDGVGFMKLILDFESKQVEVVFDAKEAE